MPTKRKSVTRNIIPQITDEQLYFLSDGLLGVAPKEKSFELFLLEGDEARTEKLWNEHREMILEEWIKARPGTRPARWWQFDAPRMTADDLEKNGWDGSYTSRLCDPRQRLGGTGTPNHEALAYAPSFAYGLPDTGYITQFDCDYYNGRATDVHGAVIPCRYQDGDFDGVPIDPESPPVYESQASYLRRHDLFVPGEARRLKSKDFEPEVVLEDEEVSVQ